MGTIKILNDFISYKLEDDSFELILKEAFEYSLLSIPFTINRMSYNQLEKRLENITKGKLAELLFEKYCQENALLFDFESGKTPFYQRDKRDFIYKNKEWDLKNNFIKTSSLIVKKETLGNLPALIPDKNEYDQWSKRKSTYFNSSQGSAYVFSFMISKLVNGPLESDLISINLSKHQLNFLEKAVNKFQGKTQKEAPYKGELFLNKWEEISIPNSFDCLHIGFNSPIYFCAMATELEWPLFKKTPPTTFADGLIRTRIINQSCAIKNLPSFKNFLAS